MNDLDSRIGHALCALGDETRPHPDLWERVQGRVQARRRRRITIAVSAAAAVFAVAVVAGLAASGSPKRHSSVIVQTTPTPPTPHDTNTVPHGLQTPTTRESAPTTTSSTTALAAFVAAHPDAVVHSTPIAYGNTQIAVVGLEPDAHHRAIVVLSLADGRASPIANLALPYPYYDIARDLPVQTVDVTGDGLPDFVVRINAANNGPGVLVSADGGTWRLIPLSPNPSDVYIGRDPTIVNGQLHSSRNDCVPDCAQGHTTTITWRYNRQTQQLVNH
jgi:hypothetical protein